MESVYDGSTTCRSISKTGRRKRLRSTASLTSMLAALLIVSIGQAQDGAHVIRIEAPFASSAPAWLPLRLDINVADGRPVLAVATAIHRNLTAHPVDVVGLRLDAGRWSGSVTVRFQADDHQRARGHAKAIPAQVLSLDVPMGELSAPALGTARWERNADENRAVAGKAAARAWRVPPSEGDTFYAEIQLMRWNNPPPAANGSFGGQFDGMTAGALLLRCVIRNGVAGDWVCLQAPERYSMGTADQLWKVEGASVGFSGGQLSGNLKLVAADDPALRDMVAKNPKFIPLPDQPVPVEVTARVVGSMLVGTAELANATPTTTAVLGCIRAWPFARHADRQPRTWRFDAEPSPALVEAARDEALKPIRPGEPGERAFWSDAAMFGGYDIFDLNGKRVVSWNRHPDPRLIIEPVEEFRAKLLGRNPRPALSSIAPPTFNNPEVPGAVRYRFTLGKESVELPHPWSPPIELWKRTEPTNDWQNLLIQGLDAASRPVGTAITIRIARRTSFQGPYIQKPPRTYRDAALLSARWMRDNPANTAFRINTGMGASWYPNGDGQLFLTTYSGLYAGLVLSELSPDAGERASGLDMAMTISDLWLRFFANNYLGDTYKGWAFDQWVYGTAWLDLYRLTSDPRYKEAVVLQARRLTSKQLASGGFGEISPEGAGGASIDPETGLPCIHSMHWPSMQQWDPSSILYLLGRVRKDLKTDEFRAAESRIWEWLQHNSIARFDWRRQGPHASEYHKLPWPTMADCALHCYEYLALDLPGGPSDPALMEDLLRWIEDQEVDWRRNAHPTEVHPRITKLNLTRDPQPRFALACARQARRTGCSLWQAKADALAGAVVISQFPNSGQIPPFPNIGKPWSHGIIGYHGPGSGDGGSRGEYATLALSELARLTVDP